MKAIEKNNLSQSITDIQIILRDFANQLENKYNQDEKAMAICQNMRHFLSSIANNNISTLSSLHSPFLLTWLKHFLDEIQEYFGDMSGFIEHNKKEIAKFIVSLENQTHNQPHTKT